MKGLRLHTFQSRLARRWFVWLLIATLLPLGTASWAIYSRVTYDLESSVSDRLRDQAKYFGLVTLENLRYAEDELKGGGDESAAVGALSFFESRRRIAFNALDTLEDEAIRELAQSAVLSEQAVLKFIPRDGAHRPVIAVRSSASLSVLLGEIRADRLTVDPILIPSYTQLCLSTRNIAIMCIADPETVASFDQVDTVSGQWSLFLASTFGADDLRFTITQPKEHAYSIVNGLRDTMLPGILIVVCAALLAGIFLVRTTLDPIEVLTRITTRFARGDRGVRADIRTGDELEVLGDSFDEMAQLIGDQLDELEILSELDGQLIQGADIHIVAESVLGALHAALPSARHSLLMTTDRPESCQYFWMTEEGGHDSRAMSGSFGSLVSPIAPSSETLSKIAPDHPLAAAVGLDASYACFTTLVSSGDHYNALIVSAFETEVVASPDQRTRFNAVVQRLTVALTALENARSLYNKTFVDSVTKLPNRHALLDRLDQAIQSALHHRHRGGLIVLNLDRFRQVNDLLGHSEANSLLQTLGRRLTDLMPTGATVSRLGADEFAVLLPISNSLQELENRAAILLEAVAAPTSVGDGSYSLTASIGITVFPDDAGSADSVLGHAAKAMFIAKHAGGGRCRFYDDKIDRDVTERAQIEQALRIALVDDGALDVHYQPKISCTTGRVVGAEALVRWRDPVLGQVGPDQFIPIAESAGLIERLGKWVMQRVAKDLAAIPEETLKTAGFHIAVNVSPRQLIDTDFCQVVQEIFGDDDIAAGRIEFEITETATAEDTERLICELGDLRKLGFTIAIDDFGTGYSSFARLLELPFDELKIDRSFVHHIRSNENGRKLVPSLISLAHDLDKTVVAEGVEDADTQQFLADLNCDIAQGYFHSRPLPFEQFLQHLTDNHTAGKPNLGAAS